jgi:hypothetical protein
MNGTNLLFFLVAVSFSVPFIRFVFIRWIKPFRTWILEKIIEWKEMKIQQQKEIEEWDRW